MRPWNGPSSPVGPAPTWSSSKPSAPKPSSSRWPRRCAGTPLLLNWVEGGRTPPLPLERIAELGFALVILPLSTLLAATRAMVDVLGEIRRAGTPLPVLDRLTGFDEFGELIGLPEIDELGSRFEA
jgi:2,3-dimethylmalate lyase